MATIGSSIICMDHINFEADVKICEKLGVDYLHLDVMDGLYVPRYGIYPEIVERIADISELPMDLHLMVSDPSFAIKQFSNIKNIEYISVHLDENEKDLYKLFDQIKNANKKPGLVVNLSSNLNHVVQILNTQACDSVMFMGIHPGVLKQTSRPESVIRNLEKICHLCEGELPSFIQCDGGVSFKTIPKLHKAGITNFVCGSSTLYKDIPACINLEERRILVEKNYNMISNLIGE
jgi:ribulose-phosphate 3-epimerase